MSTKIFRYEIPITGVPVELALHGPILSGQLEYWSGHPGVEPQIILWGLHDDEAPEVTRTFLVVGTGWEIPANARYVGTAPRGSDELVWHLLEIGGLDQLRLDVGLMPEVAGEKTALSDIEITEVKIHSDPAGRIEDSVSINGSWVSNADHEELEGLANRLGWIATRLRENHERETGN